MYIAMATANFYKIPFPKALEIIRESGFEYIELDGYWKGGDWEAAQHLRGIKPKEVIEIVADNGLKIASFHDLGGLIEDGVPSAISRNTYEYLEYYDFPCIVFHPPHKKGADMSWWKKYRRDLKAELKSLSAGRLVCIENLTPFDGYAVPLLNPVDMLEFANESDIFINADTTHFAQCNIDLCSAASVLKQKIKTLHLSDYLDGKTHLYIGEGELDLSSFFKEIGIANIYSTTIECAIPINLDDRPLTLLQVAELQKKVRDLTSNL